jgi:hypothetical protein
VNVLDRAFEVASVVWSEYRGVPLSEFVPDGDPRVAAPFGKPITAPGYRWRLSQDVWDELCDYAGMNDHGQQPVGAQLFGEPVVVDEALPPNSMMLEPRA